MQYSISINNKRTNPCVLLTSIFTVPSAWSRYFVNRFQLFFSFILKNETKKKLFGKFLKHELNFMLNANIKDMIRSWLYVWKEYLVISTFFLTSFYSFSYDKNSRTCVSYHSWHSWLTCVSYTNQMKLKVPNSKDKVNPSEILRTPPWFGWLLWPSTNIYTCIKERRNYVELVVITIPFSLIDCSTPEFVLFF